MGIWMCSKNRIEVTPVINDDLLRNYLLFSQQECPQEYCNEKFTNSWFFDKENRLVSHAGKFSETCIWFRFLKEKFFFPRGYTLLGQPDVIAEGDKEFKKLITERDIEYKEWCIYISKLTPYVAPHIM